MAKQFSDKHLTEQLDTLNQRVQELVTLCHQQKIENKSLREQQKNLVEERSRLIEKNEMARTKVESMITRLKSMEASQ